MQQTLDSPWAPMTLPDHQNLPIAHTTCPFAHPSKIIRLPSDYVHYLVTYLSLPKPNNLFYFIFSRVFCTVIIRIIAALLFTFALPFLLLLLLFCELCIFINHSGVHQ